MMLSLRSAAWRRTAGAVALAFGVQSVAACYSRQPIAVGAAPLGATVVVQLTDQARVDLRGSLGAQPEFVEGRVTALNDSALTLAVRGVESLRGEQTRWAGESVVLRRAGIATVQTKQFSTARTAVLAAGIVAALAAVVLSISLTNRGSAAGDQPTAGGTPPGNGT